MAFVDVIEHLPEGSHRRDLSARLAALNDRLAALVTKDHRWLQVIDAPDASDNYPESSATAMFAYALQKSERLGIDRHGDLGRSALQALADHEVRPVEGGRRQLQNICCVAASAPSRASIATEASHTTSPKPSGRRHQGCRPADDG